MMKTKAVKVCMVLFTLGSVLLWHSTVSAGWFYDFDDGMIPSTLDTTGWIVGEPPSPPSPTFQASADSGYLRLWDSASLPPSLGGTYEGDALNTEVFHGDVHVSAIINPAGTTDDWLGLWARETEMYANYTMGFSYGGPNWGRLLVSKGIPEGINQNFMTLERLTDLNRSYFIELQVIDDPFSGYPVVTGRLFDHEGGVILLEKSFKDTGLGGVGPYTSGIAGVWSSSVGDSVLDATFDNIRAIPEPSTYILFSILVSAIPLALYRIRGRKA